MLGMIVFASSEYEPSFIRRCSVCAPAFSIMSARRPSIEMTMTWSVSARVVAAVDGAAASM